MRGTLHEDLLPQTQGSISDGEALNKKKKSKKDSSFGEGPGERLRFICQRIPREKILWPYIMKRRRGDKRMSIGNSKKNRNIKSVYRGR